MDRERKHLRAWRGHGIAQLERGRGEPSRIWFNGVSKDFFETLGVRPLLGRAPRPGDDVPNAPRVAVLNHGTWVRRFGAKPDVVGTTMLLDGNAIEIVGVMPPGLDVPRGAEFWTPVVPFLVSGTPPDMSFLDTVVVFYVPGRVRGRVDAAALRST